MVMFTGTILLESHDFGHSDIMSRCKSRVTTDNIPISLYPSTILKHVSNFDYSILLIVVVITQICC